MTYVNLDNMYLRLSQEAHTTDKMYSLPLKATAELHRYACMRVTLLHDVTPHHTPHMLKCVHTLTSLNRGQRAASTAA